MATVTSDAQLIWTVETNKTLGFATIDDLMLGDMLVSTDLDLDGILDEAWIEIEAMLGTQYETPIYPSKDIPHYTTQFLTRIHAYLATSIAVLGQGGASEKALAYSEYLRARAHELVVKVVDGGTILAGLTNTTNDPQGRSFAPAVFTKGDSPFAYFEQSFLTGDTRRLTWTPSDTYSDPNA